MRSQKLNLDVHCVLDVRCGTGESPAWSSSEQALYFVDITKAQVHRWQPGTGAHDSWTLPAVVGSLGLRQSGGLVLALRTGLHLFEPEQGALSLLAHPEGDRPDNRYNDGRVAPDGSFWVGSMDDRPTKEPNGRLYRLDPQLGCRLVDEGFVVSNGLAFSPDAQVLYHSDSRRATIWRRRHEPGTGRLGPREVFATVAPEHGRPDGAAVDVEGCYWSCGVSAGRLNRYSPAGELISWVEMPITHPTMPCFAGADLKTLYVTSLRDGLSDEQLARTPGAGSLWAVQPGVQGLPTPLYAG